MENSMKGYQKIKIYRYHMIQQFYFWIFFQRKKNPQIQKKKIYICIPMFIAALFTVANIWKPTKCPSADKWIKRTFFSTLTQWNIT